MRFFILFLFVFAFSCSGIKHSTETSGKRFNETVRYEGPKTRLSVVVFCKANRCDKKLASAVRDLLMNELVSSNRFIILERGEGLEDIKGEILLSQSGIVDVKNAVPSGLLEGADILIAGAITSVKPDSTTFFVPVLLPWKEGGRQHITGGLLEFKKSYIQMIVKLIDVRTGRVVNSLKGEGQFTRWNLLFGEGAFDEGGAVGGVALSSKIPLEKAVLNLVKKFSREITDSIPQSYYRYR
ncbi:MAG: CsgG/HfaB family protein [Persephonella sp.]|nr:CsgG/HfaB family protein [Persephonella sp.]